MIDYTNMKTVSKDAGRTGSRDEGLRAYLLKVYNYMAAALIVTGLTAFATINVPALNSLMFNFGPQGQFLGNTGLGMLVNVAPLGIAFYFSFGLESMSVERAQTMLWVFAGLMGMSLASLGYIYTGESLARTFFICSTMFGGMSIYGYSTKRDLTSMGSFLIMGLWGLIIASLVNIFLASPAIYFATSAIGVFIFLGLIAWDTQKLKAMYYAAGNSELGQKMAVMGAFSLYLDFINLFIYLLRFLGNRRD